MYKLTNQPVSKKLKPSEAEDLLVLNNYPGQRKLNEKKANRYCNLLTNGTLRPVNIAIAHCPGGVRHLMNGQHVLHACKWANKEMNAVVETYRCEEWQDVYELFASFDVHATRTQGQIFKAAQFNFADVQLRDVPLRALGSCGTALCALTTMPPNFLWDNSSSDKTSKVHQVEGHSEEVLWVAGFSDFGDMMRVGCVTAMIATRRKNATKANEFWQKVHSGLGFKGKHDPEKRAREALSGAAKSGQSKTQQAQLYSTLIVWWNSFITGEARQSVKVASMKELPKVLA